LKSFGLRKNPNIVSYKINGWTYPVEKEVIEGISDEGGLWLTRMPGIARQYQKYMLNKHTEETCLQTLRVYFYYKILLRNYME
jgi:hypothetical protein